MGGRKIFIASPHADEPIIDHKALQAIATAFEWYDELSAGTFTSYRELADAKGVHHSYVWKMLKLPHLAPSIIADLLNGKQPSGFSITKVMQGMPASWKEQRKLFGFS